MTINSIQHKTFSDGSRGWYMLVNGVEVKILSKQAKAILKASKAGMAASINTTTGTLTYVPK